MKMKFLYYIPLFFSVSYGVYGFYTWVGQSLMEGNSPSVWFSAAGFTGVVALFVQREVHFRLGKK